MSGATAAGKTQGRQWHQRNTDIQAPQGVCGRDCIVTDCAIRLVDSFAGSVDDCHGHLVVMPGHLQQTLH